MVFVVAASGNEYGISNNTFTLESGMCVCGVSQINLYVPGAYEPPEAAFGGSYAAVCTDTELCSELHNPANGVQYNAVIHV